MTLGKTDRQRAMLSSCTQSCQSVPFEGTICEVEGGTTAVKPRAYSTNNKFAGNTPQTITSTSTFVASFPGLCTAFGCTKERTASDEKLGGGLGTRLVHLYIIHVQYTGFDSHHAGVCLSYTTTWDYQGRIDPNGKRACNSCIDSANPNAATGYTIIRHWYM